MYVFIFSLFSICLGPIHEDTLSLPSSELQDPLAMLQCIMTFDEFGLAPRVRLNLHQEGTKKVNKVNKEFTWSGNSQLGTSELLQLSPHPGRFPWQVWKDQEQIDRKKNEKKTPSVPLQCPRCFPPCDTAVEAPLRVDCTHLRHS